MIDLEKYEDFTFRLASMESRDIVSFVNRVHHLNETTDVNIPLLMNAGTGLASEGGEFNEIVKKIIYQGKSLDADSIHHMKRELGDICWYFANACNALGLSIAEVIEENVHKLESRYPGGEFDVHYSENRKKDDL